MWAAQRWWRSHGACTRVTDIHWVVAVARTGGGDGWKNRNRPCVVGAVVSAIVRERAPVERLGDGCHRWCGRGPCDYERQMGDSYSFYEYNAWTCIISVALKLQALFVDQLCERHQADWQRLIPLSQ